MLIELSPNLNHEKIESLIHKLSWMGFHVVRQGDYKLALVSGVDELVKMNDFIQLPGVLRVYPLTSRFKLASRQSKPEDTIIKIKGFTIGADKLFTVAGPSSIESEVQLQACASIAKSANAQALMGDAYKPRTSPYEFQGMGMAGVKVLSEIANEYSLLSVVEVMDENQLQEVAPYIDILQVGPKNIQNYSLLKKLGKHPNPVILKRGFSTTYDELLMAAEYIMVSGNSNVILCECGIRTFETYTANTLDLNAIPALQEMTHLPVIVDPSNGSGVRSLVPKMAKAAIAAGASGIMVQIHPYPDQSISDAAQTISFATFTKMMHEVNRLYKLITSFK